MSSSRGAGAELAAALDTLDAESTDALSDEALRGQLLDLLTQANRLHAQIIRRAAAFDRRDLARNDACRNTRAWLRTFGRLSETAAASCVKTARLLPQLPALTEAARTGQASADHLSRIVTLAERVGTQTVRRVEQPLADVTAAVNPNDLQLLCNRVRLYADPDGTAPDPHVDYQRRHLSLTRFDGMIVVRGQLDPEGGAALLTALDAHTPPPAAVDERSTGQRRADALVDLARTALTTATAPTVGGTRPQIGILLTPEVLTRTAHQTHKRSAGAEPSAAMPPATAMPPGTALPSATAFVIAASAVEGSDGAELTVTAPAIGAPVITAQAKKAMPNTTTANSTAVNTLTDQMGPASTGPASTGPASTGPASTGPASTGPASTGPASTGPASTGPTTAGPPAIQQNPLCSHGARTRASFDPLTAAGVPPTPNAAWLEWVGPIADSTAQRIACDADVWRIVLDPANGLPLNLGRTRRLVPHWVRKALWARDRGCRFPGCYTPTTWTDAHHHQPWATGGLTDIDNLLLLCRHHHVLVHEGRWTIDLNPHDGTVAATRPDGRPYEIPPNQPWLN